MSRDPAFAETYPAYMQLDHEAECEDEAREAGYHFVPPLPPSPEMVETFLRRANEDAAAVLASDRRYLLTGRGRMEAEKVNAAQRAQLDATREIKS